MFVRQPVCVQFTASVCLLLQAIGKSVDAKAKIVGKVAAKGKVSAAAVLNAATSRVPLARPSTKPALNAQAKEEKVVQAEQVDSTIYFSPENAKPKRTLPPGVEDFDCECGTDPYQSPQYANDIFLYFREREVSFENHVPT